MNRERADAEPVRADDSIPDATKGGDSVPAAAPDAIEADPIDANGSGTPQGGLSSPGFLGLLGVSFFGAANDNLLKQLLTMMLVVGGLWANRLGAGSQSIVALVLAVPFILLSGYTGQVADKCSKTTVIWWVKFAEIPICLFAMVGLLLGSFWLCMWALLLLAIQSSFFGPAKFGIIPEFMSPQRLSQANGLIVAISNIAVIIGSIAGGYLADRYYPTISLDEAPAALTATEEGGASDRPTAETGAVATVDEADVEPVIIPDPNRKPLRWPIGVAMLGVAGLGLVAATRLPRLPAVAPGLKFSKQFLKPHLDTIREADWPLRVVLFSWCGFYLIAALALLLLPDYRPLLGVSMSAITNLIGLLAVSIMVGSLTVGWLSGKTIRPWFAVFGAFGMTACFAAMGLFDLGYAGLAIAVFLIGFFAGFYIVPLQALLQSLSPKSERGRFFGTANTLSFLFIAAASGIYWPLRNLGLDVPTMALVCAGLSLLGAFAGMRQLQRIEARQRAVEAAQ